MQKIDTDSSHEESIVVPEEFRVDTLLEVDRIYYKGSPFNEHIPDQVVILVDRKPIALDTILPFIFELRGEVPDLPVIWLIKDHSYIDSIKKNHILWEGMECTGEIKCFSVNNRTNILRKIIWLLNFKKKRTFLLNHGDFSSPPVDLMANYVRRGGGRLIGYARWCYPMSIARLKPYIKKQYQRHGSLKHYRYAGDFWLIPHPAHSLHMRYLVNTPLVVIGTTRNYGKWIEFLNNKLLNNDIADNKGNPIKYENRNVLTIFYPGNYSLPDLRYENSCQMQLNKILNVIREESNDALIVIKPHAICDVDELSNDIKEFDDLDIRITFTHPQILAKISNAVFFTNGSNVIDDMYVCGLPVIETSMYKNWVIEMGGSQFPNKGRIAAIEKDQIKAVIKQVINDPESLPKAELSHLVWPKADSISACLWGRGSDIENEA